MSEEYKKRIMDAILVSEKKRLREIEGPKRRNKSPEKETVRLILAACNQLGFECHVVESKAVFSESAGRYLNSQANPGFPDIVGCDQLGRALWIEVKAPGRRSTIKDHQRRFLVSKIDLNCFAVCVDSPDLLVRFYREWVATQCQKAYLLKVLP